MKAAAEWGPEKQESKKANGRKHATKEKAAVEPEDLNTYIYIYIYEHVTLDQAAMHAM